jgi:hypothetical protein
MAFTDPQSVTINAVAQSLPRVSTNGGASEYQKEDGNVKLVISRTIGKRRRYMVRLDVRKIAADPLASANNREYTAAAYLVIDAPLNGIGYSNVELKDAVLGLAAWLSASSGANVTKVVSNEN